MISEFVFVLSQNWERCEAGLADSMLQLKDVKTRLNQSMPEFDDELQSTEKYYKVHTAGHTNTTQHKISHITETDLEFLCPLAEFYLHETFCGDPLWRQQ